MHALHYNFHFSRHCPICQQKYFCQKFKIIGLVFWNYHQTGILRDNFTLKPSLLICHAQTPISSHIGVRCVAAAPNTRQDKECYEQDDATGKPDVGLFEPRPWSPLECRAGRGEGHKGGNMSRAHTVPYHAVTCYDTIYLTIPHTTPYYTIPHTTPYYTLPHHIIPYQDPAQIGKLSGF